MHILDTNLNQIYKYQRFSPSSIGCLFIGITVPLTTLEVLKCVRSHWSVVNIVPWATGVLFRRSLPVPISGSVNSANYFNRVSRLMLEFWFIWSCFLKRMRICGLLAAFYMWDYNFLNTICWRINLFSNMPFWPFCQKYFVDSCMGAWVSVWVLYLTCRPVYFLPAPCCCHHYDLLYNFKLCIVSIIFLRVLLAIHGLSYIPMNFKTIFLAMNCSMEFGWGLYKIYRQLLAAETHSYH